MASALVLPSPDGHAVTPESDLHLNPHPLPIENQRIIGLDWPRVAAIIGVMAVVVVILDQLAKGVVLAWIGPGQPHQRWELAGSLLAFEYVENTGAAFGILAGRTWLLSMLALVVGLAFLFALRREMPFSGGLRLSIGLVIGGGIGNLIDRLRLGFVIDYIAVGVWPKFNVADSAITIGLILMAWTTLRDDTFQEKDS